MRADGTSAACVVCLASEARTPEDAATFVLSALATDAPEGRIAANLCERHQRELLEVIHLADQPRCGRSKAPPGWTCTRDAGHEGPCAAHELAR